MHIVALAWIFVVLLMALAEAVSSRGSVLGALITLVLYGLLPLAIVLYLMATPMRRRARRTALDQAAEASDVVAERSAAADGDGGGHATGRPGSAIAAVRKEP